MTPTDALTFAGGGSLVVALATVLTLLIKRYSAQDTGWKTIVDQLTTGQAELRQELGMARTEIGRLVNELAVTRQELAAARLQIAELQRWEERHDQAP